MDHGNTHEHVYIEMSIIVMYVKKYCSDQAYGLWSYSFL